MNEGKMTVEMDIYGMIVEVSVEGVKGQSCTALTAGLEKAIGEANVIKSCEVTEEYYEEEGAEKEKEISW